MTARTREIASLDVMRLAAAQAVMFYHLVFMSWAEEGSRGIRAVVGTPVVFADAVVWASLGWIGVQIFFVISGFVILMSAQDKSASDFLIGRVTRIVPALWFFTVLSGLVMLASGVLSVAEITPRFLRSMVLFPVGPWVDEEDAAQHDHEDKRRQEPHDDHHRQRHPGGIKPDEAARLPLAIGDVHPLHQRHHPPRRAIDRQQKTQDRGKARGLLVAAGDLQDLVLDDRRRLLRQHRDIDLQLARHIRRVEQNARDGNQRHHGRKDRQQPEERHAGCDHRQVIGGNAGNQPPADIPPPAPRYLDRMSGRLAPGFGWHAPAPPRWSLT